MGVICISADAKIAHLGTPIRRVNLLPGCDASYVSETSRHLQQRLHDHLGKSGTIRKHIEYCQPSLSLENFDKNVSILATSQSLPKLLTLEALFIKAINPSLNTKDEFRSRTLTLKF